ncbi:MAG: outer membrane protein assembly factor BamE [Enterobacterales bacterium]|nr:outer membrane protein assembly factor BamE [Enterobacterales bacterium]
MIKRFSLVFVFLLSSCVYTLSIQQGNILDQKDIDKLRPDLTKNQVVFVLGNPVADDAFSDDKWVYFYSFKNKSTGVDTVKKLTLNFSGDKLVTAEGDYEIPESLQMGASQAKKAATEESKQ